MSRTVTVYSTAGDSRGTNVASSATKWSDLQRDLSAASINFSGMKAIEGVSKHTFDSPDATLPEGDFRLFLMPVRTKSGGNPAYSEGDNPIPPEKEESNIGIAIVHDKPLPGNSFGEAATAVQKAYEKEMVWLSETDRLRLVIMITDLTRLSWQLLEDINGPVAKEMKDIAEGIDDINV